jgi:ribonuclease P protein component
VQRDQRLRRKRDFQAVYTNTRPTGGRLLAVRAHNTGGEHTRFGFVVPKAVGNAVTRNRVRRRLREAARALPIRPGLDVIIAARPAAASASFPDLSSALMALCARAGILETPAKPFAEGTKAGN